MEKYDFNAIIGDSPQMQKVLDMIKTVAAHEITVLLQGRSGTGKELVARAIHYGSKRAEKPFVVIDCSILPETLVESEIFGYEKGAFTGAYERKKGKFELANQGTVFLDEIGNLTTTVQIKLLRVLQEREIERLGGKRPIKVDVRLIAAANTNLERAIKHGRFREDLFYRLNVFPIQLPPLRDREGDVLLLAGYFLKHFNQEFKKKKTKISPEAMELLAGYHWPGNVRELRNVIESAVLLSDGVIFPQHLSEKIQSVRDESVKMEGSLKEVTRQARQRAEKKLILKVLKDVNWNRSKASKILKVDYKTLYNKMKEYNIKRV
ncbi:MAG: sigma-54-dependent Fis family transcriptional regulator, partial [Candidatus Aminicenantes bacterium]|nr:sigma-54-dependent Fis family transcriptional regulator [Candidatus Aminicenantes bacterium]